MTTLSNAARVRLLYGHAGIVEDDVPSTISHAMARLDGRQLEAVELVVAAAIQSTAIAFLEASALEAHQLLDLVRLEHWEHVDDDDALELIATWQAQDRRPVEAKVPTPTEAVVQLVEAFGYVPEQLGHVELWPDVAEFHVAVLDEDGHLAIDDRGHVLETVDTHPWSLPAVVAAAFVADLEAGQ